jgi:hypothetical protein
MWDHTMNITTRRALVAVVSLCVSLGLVAEARTRALGAGAAVGTNVAKRESPATYIQKTPFVVTIAVTPDIDVQAWAVEEKVPAGWLVTEISAGGHWNKDEDVVRWGPYMDDAAQTLKYTLTPLAGASGPYELKGTASFDGADVTIGGKHTLAPAPVVRPGDPGRF